MSTLIIIKDALGKRPTPVSVTCRNRTERDEVARKIYSGIPQDKYFGQFNQKKDLLLKVEELGEVATYDRENLQEEED